MQRNNHVRYIPFPSILYPERIAATTWCIFLERISCLKMNNMPMGQKIKGEGLDCKTCTNYHWCVGSPGVIFMALRLVSKRSSCDCMVIATRVISGLDYTVNTRIYVHGATHIRDGGPMRFRFAVCMFNRRVLKVTCKRMYIHVVSMFYWRIIIHTLQLIAMVKYLITQYNVQFEQHYI